MLPVDAESVQGPSLKPSTDFRCSSRMHMNGQLLQVVHNLCPVDGHGRRSHHIAAIAATPGGLPSASPACTPRFEELPLGQREHRGGNDP